MRHGVTPPGRFVRLWRTTPRVGTVGWYGRLLGPKGDLGPTRPGGESSLPRARVRVVGRRRTLYYHGVCPGVWYDPPVSLGP